MRLSFKIQTLATIPDFSGGLDVGLIDKTNFIWIPNFTKGAVIQEPCYAQASVTDRLGQDEE